MQALWAVTLAEDARYPERKETRDKIAALLHPDAKDMRESTYFADDGDPYVLPDAMMEDEDESNPFQGLAPPIGL